MKKKKKKKKRIITYLKKMHSCRQLFKTKENLPFYSLYIVSLLYVVNNKHLFTKNLEAHKQRSTVGRTPLDE